MKKKYMTPLLYVHFIEINTVIMAVSGKPEEEQTDCFNAKGSYAICYDDTEDNDTEEEYYPICWE